MTIFKTNGLDKTVTLVRDLSSISLGWAFGPTALAANEKRNECYVRSSGLPYGDQICVFDMTTWTLLHMWKVQHNGTMCCCGTGEKYNTMAFNENNGRLYIPNLPRCGLCVMDPVTGAIDQTIFSCFHNDHALFPTSLVLWAGSVGHLGDCLVVGFVSENLVRVYKCDTMLPVLSFHVHKKEYGLTAGAYSIQFYHGEFYIGEFHNNRIAIYSIDGTFQRTLVVKRTASSVPMEHKPTISIHPSSESMAVLNFNPTSILLVE